MDIMVMNFKIPASGKPRNLVSKDLRSPKYRMRVAVSKKVYDRNRIKRTVQKDAYVGT
jgi:RNase P protein component